MWWVLQNQSDFRSFWSKGVLALWFWSMPLRGKLGWRHRWWIKLSWLLILFGLTILSKEQQYLLLYKERLCSWRLSIKWFRSRSFLRDFRGLWAFSQADFSKLRDAYQSTPSVFLSAMYSLLANLSACWSYWLRLPRIGSAKRRSRRPWKQWRKIPSSFGSTFSRRNLPL